MLRLAFLLFLGGVLAGGASAQGSVVLREQSASAALAAPAELPPGHSPRGALWRAAAVPGWGQLYNRQYYKIPIVYAGFGGIVAAALVTNRRYLLYRHAYHYADPRLWVDGEPTHPEYLDDYLRVLDINGIPREDADDVRGRLAPDFRRMRDNLRRNRDLLYIGVGLFYGLSALDAYVSAHLLDFDVGEDLSLSVRPALRGVVATLHFERRAGRQAAGGRPEAPRKLRTSRQAGEEL